VAAARLRGNLATAAGHEAAADDAFDTITGWLGIEDDPLPLCLPRSRASRVL
jgi:hypothetical protein